MQVSGCRIVKRLRERLLHLYHASVAIVMAMSPGRAGQRGGQRRAFDDGAREGKLNFKPQTTICSFRLLRPSLATPIHLAHSINDGGGRVRTLS